MIKLIAVITCLVFSINTVTAHKLSSFTGEWQIENSVNLDKYVQTMGYLTNAGAGILLRRNITSGLKLFGAKMLIIYNEKTDEISVKHEVRPSADQRVLSSVWNLMKMTPNNTNGFLRADKPNQVKLDEPFKEKFGQHREYSSMYKITEGYKSVNTPATKNEALILEQQKVAWQEEISAAEQNNDSIKRVSPLADFTYYIIDNEGKRMELEIKFQAKQSTDLQANPKKGKAYVTWTKVREQDDAKDIPQIGEATDSDKPKIPNAPVVKSTDIVDAGVKKAEPVAGKGNAEAGKGAKAPNSIK